MINLVVYFPLHSFLNFFYFRKMDAILNKFMFWRGEDLAPQNMLSEAVMAEEMVQETSRATSEGITVEMYAILTVAAISAIFMFGKLRDRRKPSVGAPEQAEVSEFNLLKVVKGYIRLKLYWEIYLMLDK